MKNKIFGLFKLILKLFKKKKLVITRKTNNLPKRIVEINIPDFHYLSLGIHRIRDTPL